MIFFLDDFQRSTDQRFSSVLDKFTLYSKIIEEENKDFYSIFKGVLLLNLLYKVVAVDESFNSLVSPNSNNIKSMFEGTKYEKQVDACLNFFNEKQIISRNPDDLYLVESSVLPIREVEKAKNELRNNFNTIDKILLPEQKGILINSFASLILRQTEVYIADAALPVHLMKNTLLSFFRNDYTIHIALLIAKNSQEHIQAKNTIENILLDTSFENIIFILLHETLKQNIIETFIDYHARALVAERHNLKDEQITHLNYAKKLIDQWIQSAKTSTIDWFLKSTNNDKVNDNKSKALLSDFPKIVNRELSLEIFRYGLENLSASRKNYNIWKYKMSRTSAENFLFAEDLNAIEQKTISEPYKSTREILKNNSGQYIVRENFSFRNDIDRNHPLLKIYQEVQIRIDNKEGEIFNLGETLEFLCKPPYGLFPSMICMAASGFVMNNYTGRLYEAGTGQPIEKEIMRDKVVHLFEYWAKRKSAEKLEVRLGTEEEKKLIADLCEIFEIAHKVSLNDTKWAIRGWIKTVSKFPIWVFKLVDNISEALENAIETIIYLIESVDRDFTQQDIKDALEMIDSVKTDLLLLFQKYDQCDNLFRKWLDSIENITIEKDKYTDVIEYVRQNMPEEIGVASWTEDKVREIVKDWLIKEDKPIYNLKAKFTYKKQSEHIPLQIQFIDESEGNPVSWEWNFDVHGTGDVSNDKYPDYIYEKSGIYTVSLKVTDANGNSDLKLEQDYIKVDEIPKIDDSQKEKIVQKIINYQGDFKELLLKVVNEHKEFLNILDKYLND